MERVHIDDISRLLSNHYRRRTIQLLRETPAGELGFDALSDRIFQEATGEEVGEHEVLIRLHHYHLPKLHEQGVIEYDPKERRVSYHPNQQVEAMLDGISANVSSAAADD